MKKMKENFPVLKHKNSLDYKYPMNFQDDTKKKKKIHT